MQTSRRRRTASRLDNRNFVQSRRCINSDVVSYIRKPEATLTLTSATTTCQGRETCSARGIQQLYGRRLKAQEHVNNPADLPSDQQICRPSITVSLSASSDIVSIPPASNGFSRPYR